MGLFFWRKKRRYILVVDDEADIRRLLGDILRARGYEVACAKDAAEAIKTAAADPPMLFVVDIMLPGTDGISLVKHLKDDRRLKPIPVVMVSALQQAKDVERAFAMGAAGYIIKPFTPDRVVAKIEEALGRGDGARR